MSEEVKKPQHSETYLGTFGGFLPLLVMVVCILLLSIMGMRGTRSLWCAGFLGLTAGFFVYKNKNDFQKALVSGLQNPTLVIMILIFIIASVFSKILSASGLTDALVVVMEMLHISAQVLPLACFLIAALMSTASGSAATALLALVPLMFPIGMQMGVHPGLLAGAIASGSVFGDNLAPISDSVIASTQGVGADINEAVKQRIKYSLAAGVPCIVLYLILGIKMLSGPAGTVSAESGSLTSLVFLALPVLLIVMILMKVNFLVALLCNSLIGSILLMLLGRASLVDFFAADGIIATGVTGMSDSIFFMMFIFMVLSLTEQSGALQKMVTAIGNIAKKPTSAEAICAGLVCVSVIVTTSGVSSMGFCGPLISRILAPFRISRERMANFIGGMGNGVCNLLPYSMASITTVGLCVATGTVDAGSFTPLSFIQYSFFPMALLVVYWFAILSGWGRTFTKE